AGAVPPRRDGARQEFSLYPPAQAARVNDFRAAIAKFLIEVAIEQVSRLVAMTISINDHFSALPYFTPISLCASVNNVRSAICETEIFLSIFARVNASSRAS